MGSNNVFTHIFGVFSSTLGQSCDLFSTVIRIDWRLWINGLQLVAAEYFVSERIVTRSHAIMSLNGHLERVRIDQWSLICQKNRYDHNLHLKIGNKLNWENIHRRSIYSLSMLADFKYSFRGYFKYFCINIIDCRVSYEIPVSYFVAIQLFLDNMKLKIIVEESICNVCSVH